MPNIHTLKHKHTLRASLIIGVLAICAICATGVWLILNYTHIELVTKQTQWHSSMPSAYYIELYESHSDGGQWRWAASIFEGKLLTATLLSINTHGQSNLTSLFDGNKLTVERLFELAESCTSRGLLDCGLDFDSRFGYPKRLFSYELFIIEVDTFIPCNTVTIPCNPKLRAPP
jgi:hypothetical protein